MNILVTGSNGFLASYFRKYYENIQNHNIIYGTCSKINSDTQVKFNPLYSNIGEVLENTNVDTIIHFASIIPKTFDEANYELYNGNVQMIENLYKYSINNDVNKFIYISSFGSMLNPTEHDVKDYYTLSKVVGDLYVNMMQSKNIDASSLKISSPFGEFYNARNVLTIFTNKALKNEAITVFGSGKREQNFTYAGNIVKAISLILDRKVNGTYDIVSKSNISMLDLANLIVDLTNSNSDIITNTEVDPQENYKPNYNYLAAQNDFAYKPIYDFKEGLIRFIEWYKNK